MDNRPSSICVDMQGQLTDDAYITARTLTIEMVEMQALAGYMECGGLKGRNLQTLTQVDHMTRGGRDLFVWGLDANVEPDEWDTIKVGEKTWLEHMDAEIVTVSNSKFTCRGKQGQEGGSNID